MTKSELIAILAEKNPYLYHRDIERIVNCFFDTISDALAQTQIYGNNDLRRLRPMT